MRVDVNYKDVEFPTIESGVVGYYGFLSDVSVDPREVEPNGLTHGPWVHFLKAKNNVQSSNSAFLTIFLNRGGNPSVLTNEQMPSQRRLRTAET